MFCEHCGKPVAPADRYCAACLAPRTPTASVRPPPLTPPPSPLPPAPLPSAWAAPPPTWGAPASLPPTGPAGFWLRFAAMLVDSVVLGVAMAALFMVLGVAVGVSAAVATGPARSGLAVLALAGFTVVMVAGQWAYFAIMESSPRQATLGKLALGLTVTDLEGRRLGLGRATGRHFAKLLSGIPLNLGYLLAAFTERKQALHDLVAGTLVVRKAEAKAGALVAAVVAGGFGAVTLLGILAAIAIPNFIRYQLRAKEAEAPAMLRTLHAAELDRQAVAGRFVQLNLPDRKPGPARLAWRPEELATARALGWTVGGPTYFTYRVAVAQTEDGAQSFSTCAEADLDGDGEVAAWVTWQPVELPGGGRAAPAPPCSHSPSLARPVELQDGDPAGTPVRVSPDTVF